MFRDVPAKTGGLLSIVLPAAQIADGVDARVLLACILIFAGDRCAGNPVVIPSDISLFGHEWAAYLTDAPHLMIVRSPHHTN